MELVKAPVPVPLVVLESDIVGFCDVLQQTPLAVIGLPPSDVIVPPLVAEMDVKAELCVVEIVGITGTASLFFLHDTASVIKKNVAKMKLILFIGFGFYFL